MILGVARAEQIASPEISLVTRYMSAGGERMLNERETEYLARVHASVGVAGGKRDGVEWGMDGPIDMQSFSQ